MPDFHFAQSILIYSKEVAQAAVDPSWKITATPEDIGEGGSIHIAGSNFMPEMKVVLGRKNVAGVVLHTKYSDNSDLEAEIPDYIPGDDFFLAVLSSDGKRRSAPFGVMSTYPEREDEFSQNSIAPSADRLNDQGSQLMKTGKGEAAAVKFVMATRVPLCRAGVSYAPKECAIFAIRAATAYYKAGKYQESVAWSGKSLEIDPQLATAYADLGDALAKLHRYSEASQAYDEFLEHTSDSKSKMRVERRLKTLPMKTK